MHVSCWARCPQLGLLGPFSSAQMLPLGCAPGCPQLRARDGSSSPGTQIPPWVTSPRGLFPRVQCCGATPQQPHPHGPPVRHFVPGMNCWGTVWVLECDADQSTSAPLAASWAGSQPQHWTAGRRREGLAPGQEILAFSHSPATVGSHNASFPVLLPSPHVSWAASRRGDRQHMGAGGDKKSSCWPGSCVGTPGRRLGGG